MKTKAMPLCEVLPAMRKGDQTRNNMNSVHAKLTDAIARGETLQLEYQGNPREIIPLVFGRLRNGREAVLCYKIGDFRDGEPELLIRLYHLEKIRHVRKTPFRHRFNRKIDYYLTKHFTTVYQKC